MNDSKVLFRTASIVGWLSLAIGLSVFAIRLQHAGPYALPAGGNLLAGTLALALGALFVGPWLRATGSRLGSVVTGLLLVASPVVMFFALYSTLAELEEVVVLRVQDASGATADLRLWIVDDQGTPWVAMGRGKADAHGLDEARVELLRGGETHCVIARRSDDRSDVERTRRLRHEKYSIQRLATSIGVFGSEPSAEAVTLRLDPCE